MIRIMLGDFSSEDREQLIRMNRIIKKKACSLGVMGAVCSEAVLQVMFPGAQQDMPDVTGFIMHRVQFNFTDASTCRCKKDQPQFFAMP